MNYSPRSRTLGIVFGVCLAVLCLCLAGTGTVAAQSADIVVATDDSGDYTSIQNAVDNASDGDRIRVNTGTYEQHTEIRKNITLYSPNGATIANSSAVASQHSKIDARSGFQIFDHAAPTISGFTLTDWQWAISAGASDGDWTVKDTEIVGGNCGVCAAGTSGEWTLTNIEITDAEPAVSGISSSGAWSITNTTIQGGKITLDDATGDWTVRNSEVRDSPDDGIDAVSNTGQWTIDNVTIENIDAVGIDAENTNAAQTPVIRDTTVVGTSEEGIDIADSASDILITRTTVRNTGPGEFKNAIRIEASTGDWTIEHTTIENVSGEGIDAYEQPASSQATLRNLTITDTQNHGVNFYNSSGDWEVIGSEISNSDTKGIEAGDSAGDWHITSTTVEGTNQSLIGASGAVGNWNVHESILSTSGTALDATEATKGNASYNYWGAANGPSGAFNGSGGAANGNVTVTPYYVDASLTETANGTDTGQDGTVPPVTGDSPPTDTDGDGKLEDINGDESSDVLDVQALFQNLDDETVKTNPESFDFNADGTVDILDIQTLFNQL